LYGIFPGISAVLPELEGNSYSVKEMFGRDLIAGRATIGGNSNLFTLIWAA
jgi:hypothetical protein